MYVNLAEKNPRVMCKSNRNPLHLGINIIVLSSCTIQPRSCSGSEKKHPNKRLCLRARFEEVRGLGRRMKGNQHHFVRVSFFTSRWLPAQSKHLVLSLACATTGDNHTSAMRSSASRDSLSLNRSLVLVSPTSATPRIDIHNTINHLSSPIAFFCE